MYDMNKLGFVVLTLAVIGTIIAPLPALGQPVECLNEVATIVGTHGDDILDGTDGVDVIHGLGGNDVINGKEGNDIICGGDGDDRIRGGMGDDVIYGSAGNDTLFGLQGKDKMYGGPGEDKMYGGIGNDRLSGGADNDELFGGMDNDRLFGREGNDRIFGDAGNDALHGNLGNDLLVGGEGDDRLLGNDGNDRLVGGNGNDFLEGLDGDDLLFAGLGDDDLKGGDGNDELHGGDGFDACAEGEKLLNCNEFLGSETTCEELVPIGEDMIADSGFESGKLIVDDKNPLGCWGSTGDRFGGTVSITDEDKHSGVYSLKITSGSMIDVSKAGYVYQFIESDTTAYTFSLWYKGIEGNTGVRTFTGWVPWWLGVGPFNPEAGASIQLGQEGLPADNQWHHVLAVNTPSETKWYVDGEYLLSRPGSSVLPTLVMFGDTSTNAAGGTYYIDDVCISTDSTDICAMGS